MDMRLRQMAGMTFIILIIVLVIFLYLGVNKIEKFIDAGRCGVDLPSCSGERVRCINGYCKSDIPKHLPLLSDLPMTPPTKYPYA